MTNSPVANFTLVGCMAAIAVPSVAPRDYYISYYTLLHYTIPTASLQLLIPPGLWSLKCIVPPKSI